MATNVSNRFWGESHLLGIAMRIESAQVRAFLPMRVSSVIADGNVTMQQFVLQVLYDFFDHQPDVLDSTTRLLTSDPSR